MGKKRDIWISPRDGDWAVQREGADRATAVTENKQDAVDSGREIAKRDGVDLIIQGKDGKIQSHDSYGKDPYPPKDTEH